MRDSRFELLRIVAMAMILTVHLDGASLGLPDNDLSWDSADWWKSVFEAISIVGVNVFVLISGYFGIRLTISRLVSYVGICAFYGLGIYALRCFLGDAELSLEDLCSQVQIFSGTDLWFIRDYLFLMLISPLLNAGLQSMPKRQMIWLVVSLLVINCYFGWWCGGKINPTGYTLWQMVMMYVLGYMARAIKAPLWISVLLWLGATTVTLLLARNIPSNEAYAYNSPFVILAAFALMLVFRNFKIHSRTINYIASSTFAIYLIHKNPNVWVNFVKKTVNELASQYSGVIFFLSCAGFGVIVFFGSIFIDKIRSSIVGGISSLCRKLMPKPIQRNDINKSILET